jgi:hypothetical protein
MTVGGEGCDMVKSQNAKHRSPYPSPSQLPINPLPLPWLPPKYCLSCSHLTMPLTRSSTKNSQEDPPQPKWPLPTLKGPKQKTLQDTEAAKEHAADILQSLQQEQEQELEEALGIGYRSVYGRGHGRGGGHGGGYSGEIATEDAEMETTSTLDEPDESG